MRRTKWPIQQICVICVEDVDSKKYMYSKVIYVFRTACLIYSGTMTECSRLKELLEKRIGENYLLRLDNFIRYRSDE